MSGALKRASGLGIIPAAFLVHNAEEAVGIPILVGRAQEKLTSVLGPGWYLPSVHEYWWMLAGLTLAVAILWLATLRWASLTYALVVFQGVMTFNVLTHIGGAVALGGYAPGLVTAVLVEAVVSALVFRRVADAGWMSRWQWVLLPILAVTVGGPGLVVLVLRGS